MVGFFIKTAYKMIIYEKRSYNWNLFPIDERFRNTPTSFPIQFWITYFFQLNYQNNFLAIRDFCCYVGSHI